MLYKGKSLLPAGIYDIKGTFQKNEVVEVVGPNGLLGKGEVLFSSGELKAAMGKRSEELSKDVLSSIVVIHRNKWVKA